MNVNDNATIAGILDQAKFAPIDYVVFAGMLALSSVTGIYFGCCKKGSDVEVYLMGNRNMRVFPVAMSLVGSYISGVTILGTPAEIYNYGTQYWFIIISVMGSSLIVATVYLPVFCKLKLQSSYEYLDMRFNKSLRTMASIMFLIDEIMFLPIVVYVPALAFNQVTGLNIHIIGSTVCLVCIFYTVLGGLRAVVWTDTWQIAIMFGSVFVITIIGTIQAGGFYNIFQSAADGNRIVFTNVSFDFLQRHTLWSVIVGGTLYWTAFNSVNQTMVQRYMALPSLKKAKQSIMVFTCGVVLVISLCCLTGLLIYDRLGSCDPKTSGQLQSDDQLLPAYVALISSNLPGLLGIFMAGIFGAALSSMSVILNSSATVVLQDIINGLLGKQLSSKFATIIARLVISLLGLASLGALFVVEHLVGILSVATGLSAIAASTTFSMFTLGMLWPWATPFGTLVGAISGAIVCGWASFGSQVVAAQGFTPSDYKSPSLSGCSKSFNESVVWPKISPRLDSNDIFPLYGISYNWIVPLGLITSLIVGIIISAFTYKQGTIENLDPDLLSPVIYKFLPKSVMLNAGQATRRRGKNYNNSNNVITSSLNHPNILSGSHPENDNI